MGAKFIVTCPQCQHTFRTQDPRSRQFQSNRVTARRTPTGFEVATTLAPHQLESIPYGFWYELATALIAGGALGLTGGLVAYAFVDWPDVIILGTVGGLSLGALWFHDYSKTLWKRVIPWATDLLKQADEARPTPRSDNIIEVRHHDVPDRHWWWERTGALPVPFSKFKLFAQDVQDADMVVGADWYPKSQGKLFTQSEWTKLRDALIKARIIYKEGRSFLVSNAGRHALRKVADAR